jgi:hypothetical protein
MRQCAMLKVGRQQVRRLLLLRSQDNGVVLATRVAAVKAHMERRAG